MRLPSARLALASASLVMVSFLVVVDLGRTSPGPLSSTHAGVDGLSEKSCEQCHGDGDQTLADACNACHEPIAEQLARSSGFHGQLERADECGRCHVEHHGVELALVDTRTFTLAGFDPREAYAHEGIAFSLSGRHASLGCVECHANADLTALAPGEQRFLGATQECAACHEDPHEGRMVAECQSCHGQEQAFTDLAGFVHGSGFPLTGVHAGSACLDCHAAGTAYAVEALGGHDAPPARSCGACHEESHSDPFIDAVAQLVQVSSAASCESCHPTDGLGFSEFDAQATERLHVASGFSLVAPHQQLDCSSCHDPATIGEAYGPRSADDCAACHETPHGEQFDSGVFGDHNCLDCHARERFVPGAFGAEAHALTAFALTAGHAAPACEDCHRVAAEATLGAADFGAVARDCSGCHADVHDGLFVRAAFDLRVGSGCESCHVTSHFSEVAVERFDHARWTGFELDGSHAEATCEACHERSIEADTAGRRFGRVADLFGTPSTNCATCHATVHVGEMAAARDDCAACHATSHFSDVERSQFAHQQETGFALVGAHERAGCEVCHAPRAKAGVQDRVFGLASETFPRGTDDCAGCHDDAHRGRFDGPGAPLAINGRTSCARCHTEESFSFNAGEEFDHKLWTGHALDGAHARASCEACHEDPARGRRILRPAMNCSACHADPHSGQFGTRGEDLCVTCHESAGSFAVLAFDHQQDSRFALDDEHRTLDCAACHKPWPLAGGGEAVRYKPLGVECADCHLGGEHR